MLIDEVINGRFSREKRPFLLFCGILAGVNAVTLPRFYTRRRIDQRTRRCKHYGRATGRKREVFSRTAVEKAKGGKVGAKARPRWLHD